MLIALIFLGLLTPFFSKAVSIDDPLYIWTSEQILRSPDDFYGFNVNWYGYEMPMYQVMKNPTLSSYYLALTGKYCDWRATILHLAMLLPAILLAFGIYNLAATLCALLLYVPLSMGSLSAMAAVARAPCVEAARLDHAAVFVRSLGALDFPPWAWAYYPRNPSPDLGDRMLYVKDLGEERDRDLNRFMPDRAPFWMGVRDGHLVLLQLPR
jgi:hypothetical protein